MDEKDKAPFSPQLRQKRGLMAEVCS